jgi:hypothetical protein
MKDVRPALRLFLLADVTVSGLVGGTRIFPIKMPQGEKSDSVVYHRVTETADYHMQGSSGLAQARIQIDAWSTRPDGASQLANAVHDRLSGHAGDFSFGASSPQDVLDFEAIFQVAGREDYDADADMFRMSRDYLVWYREV